jgi:hypothetical protein
VAHVRVQRLDSSRNFAKEQALCLGWRVVPVLASDSVSWLTHVMPRARTKKETAQATMWRVTKLLEWDVTGH